ncbi:MULTISPECIES: CU044_2847 family protein [Methylomonas]|uniref:Trypsin-co-occurring domain-containing protein n=1 Tax=Methylomonas koyamae TaxID=702114 RepID=A0A177N648_9GAMM|nr:CU044_2847 family protein [Methylomonas koyamae]OAI13508.1 hypothetical protein A1355_13460 [Methylomonas koyamae]
MSRTIEALKFGDETIYIEVSDVEARGGASHGDKDLQDVNALDDIVDAAEQIRGTIKALAKTVQGALAESQPKEWTLEINLGFKGSAGIPFLAEGEANGAVKVTAKWQK